MSTPTHPPDPRAARRRGPTRLLRLAERHEYLGAGAILGLITCVWFWPLLTGEQLGQSFALHQFSPWAGAVDPQSLPQRGPFFDAAIAFHPWAVVVREQMLSGQLPLWNPFEWGGTTLVGNMQSGVFFPLNWLHVVLGFDYGWGALAAVKVLVAGLGTYALSKELGSGRGGALVGGAVYMLSGPLMVWLQYPLSSAFALFPWLLLATTRVCRRGTPGSVAGVALAVALTVLAGHPESAFISVSATTVYLLALIAFDRTAHPGPGRSLRVAARWAGGTLLGAALAAVSLLPFLSALGSSVTLTDRGDLVRPDAPSLFYLLHYAMPGLLGDGEPNLYGRWPFGYFGLPALVLALVALSRYRHKPAARAISVMTAVTLMTMYRLPPVSWLLDHVQPWSTVYWAPERIYFVLALAGAVGAGAGFTALARRPLPLGRVVAVTGAVGVTIAIGFALAEASSELGAPASVKRESIVVTGLLLLAAGAVLAAPGRMRSRPALGIGLAVVVLSLVGFQNLNVILPPEEAHPSTPDAIAALQNQPHPFRIGTIRDRPDAPVMLANTAALYGLESIEGYDFPLSERWSDFQTRVLEFGGGAGFPELRRAGTPPRGAALAALRMMNVRYYLAAPGTASPAPAFETIYTGRDAVVFRDPGALPRAYVVPTTRALGDDPALAALAAGSLDPRRSALVPPEATTVPRGELARFRPARVEQPSPDHVRVHLPPGAGGWLVLANAYSSEWNASVDGRETELRPTNFAAMGVPVRASSRTVDFRLDHTRFWVGAAISLVALAGTGLLAGWGRPRRDGASGRRRPRRETAPDPRS